MNKFFKVSCALLLSLSSVNAENIDTLLDIYAKENDLSKKTIKEAAGNVIVYTRQDLERMQVKSLSELLKNVPFYRYNENKLGYTELLRKRNYPTLSSDARVYINEREIISPFYGNALGIVSKFDLAYIDHIEIYTGVTSFEFGVEPANMVVRLYTKDPNREIGGQFRTSVGSYGSNEHSLSYADVLSDFSYYAYINTKDTNEKKINYEDTPLSRDKDSLHLFLSLQDDTNRIEYNRIEGKTNLFMDGIGGGDGSPTENKTDVTYNLLGWYSTYFDGRLSLSLDYIDDKSETIEADTPYLDSRTVPAQIINPFAPIGSTVDLTYDSYLVKQKEKQISAVLKYKEKIGNHNLLGGLQYRKKDFKFKEINANVNGQIVNIFGIDTFIPFPSSMSIDIDENIAPNLFNYTSEKVYGAFLEDTYSINDNQAIVAAVKFDRITPNSGSNLENQDLHLYRLGYIYTNKDFSFKTFFVSTESRVDPNFYTRVLVDGQLDPQRDDSFTVEANWKSGSFTHGVNVFRTKQTNKLNRIDTNFFIMNTKNTFENEEDTVYGGYIRLLNTVGKFDFYNELIYRDSYEDLDAGYDFNSAITYNHTRDLKVSLKGENIFDKAIKTIYNDSPNDLGPISVSTRKVWFTLEYRF